jgi:superfamily II DNA/RNA helicase
MNIFKVHSEILDDYSSYISSFIDIKNDRIREEVTRQIESQKLWPAPLIQFNPSYAPGEPVESLCNKGILHEELKNVFKGFLLHKHQVEALELAVKGENVIVTSGTGSGKSLIFLGTIFNHLFSSGKTKGIKALIIYPMNALINSQFLEIEKFKENYEKSSGQKFPFTFGQYTGQEGKAERDKIKEEPPDILLTNYMMLELLLTRLAETSIKSSIAENLKYLVFDELHTYRGRQGADVSLLIRRIHALCSNSVTCIGTSATMASGKSINEQNIIVAKVAETIFSKPFKPDNIINEKLVKSLSGSSAQYSGSDLAACLDIKNIHADYDELKKNLLAQWIEETIALKEQDGILMRRIPLTMDEISKQLSEFTLVSKDICHEAVETLLNTSNEINNRLLPDQKPVLPFKINQFISQTGSVYVTLETPDIRKITLEGASYIKNDGDINKPLYPIVFSRTSGVEFICVKKNQQNSAIESREFNQRIDEEEQENYENGYIFFDDAENPLNIEELYDNFPETWVRINRNGTASIKKDYESRMPREIYFNERGNFSDKSGNYPVKAWYMPAPLLFDPTSGVIYDRKTSEGTKLSRLGTEGRSTSTTVLAYSIIKALNDAGQKDEEQKLLSFTDNRQDAALQAGHFNDFIKVGRLRAAIYSALNNNPAKSLDYSNIAQEVYSALGLNQALYAKAPSDFAYLMKDNEEAFKYQIMYRLLYDLKRGWRVILPNLEQCGLLQIEYRHLKELANDLNYWKDVELLNIMSADELYDFLFQLMDFFRKNYALSHTSLEPGEIERRYNIIKEKIKPEWGLDKNEQIDLPYYLRLETLKQVHQKIYTVSMGLSSYFGKYFKQLAKIFNTDIKGRYQEIVYSILEKLADASFLNRIEVKNGDAKVKLYQLRVDTIIWKLNTSGKVQQDKIRSFSLKPVEPKINKYFRDFYQQNFNLIKNLEAKEHTAQINNEDRKEREHQFRDGKISLLSCSPTMELGIDISTLNVVHLRNVPPNPANYAQRAGRAGRSGQAALIFTFCSNYSPHDQHYFRNSAQMVAGAVSSPKIDLMNEELLHTHLNAAYLSIVGLGPLEDSLARLFELTDINSLPLSLSVREALKLKPEGKSSLAAFFREAVKDIYPQLKNQSWFSDEWISRQIENVPDEFNNSLNRWRELYRMALRQMNDAQSIINDPMLTNDSTEKKQAFVNERQAGHQMDILQNSGTSSGNQLSEFYPFRYLAAEGFLPGYNFTRLPMRVYVPQNDNGEFISRPRFLGIREFAPGNIIYHNGDKYKVNQLLINDAENKMEKIKINKAIGYALTKEDYNLEYCPFSNTHLRTDAERTLYTDLLPMSECRSMSIDRINCEEEERLALGYDVKTYFTVEGGMSRIKTVNIKDDKDILLNIRYIPAATLIKINERLRSRKEPGFLVNIKTGFWKKDISASGENPDNNIRRIRLYTSDTADALYIYPMKALSFDKEKGADSIITFQYALKRAIENVFQVESNEIGVEIMGDPDWPNILVYEASQGSLGVLSQVVQDLEYFKEIINEALRICYFENGEDMKPETGPATYADLLNYYNQKDHPKIDRHLIKEPLEKLLNCSLEALTNNKFSNYDEQYEYLLERIDPNSITEKKFLKYLFDNGLKLPDKAQMEIPEIYVKPDFYYEKGNACVFCDGTPHDNPEIIKQDKLKREKLLNAGYDVVVYYYKDTFENLVQSRQDIFVKVKI